MSPLASTTLKLGDRAPNFTLPDLDGRPFELVDVIQGGSALLSFAPGIWSQTTRRQADEFEAAHEQLEALGVIPLIVVTQQAKDARRSLQAHLSGPERNLMQPALSFPILADHHQSVAREYGVFRAFSLDGVRITRPGVFLIDPTGVIAFVYVGRNDADVPHTDGLLRLVRSLTHPRLLSVAPEGLDPRAVRGWDTAILPRIVKAPAFLELDQPAVAIALPAALELADADLGSHGTRLAEPAELELASGPGQGPRANGSRGQSAPTPANGEPIQLGPADGNNTKNGTQAVAASAADVGA